MSTPVGKNLEDAPSTRSVTYTDRMCASYGLDPRMPGWREFRRGLIDLATLEALTAWATGNAGRTIRPTGIRARNLNPIIRNGLELAWWGYGPTGVPSRYSTINARSETLLTRATWRAGFASRRALIPATSWFEYEKPSKRRHSLSTGSALMIGAVTAEATIAEGTVSCYSMIMQPAPEHLASIHDRMPLLVQPELADAWLDPGREGDQQLLDVALDGSRQLASGVTVSDA